MIGYVTKVTARGNNNASNVSTIPSRICQYLNITAGDELIWDVKEVDGEELIIAKPVKKKE